MTHWGIIGTGGIASAFAGDLQLLPDNDLVAVGSRTQVTADAYGDRFNVPRRYSTYEGLVSDSGVDVVYVATPHPEHHAAALMALRAGKPVLCEKPFTLNALQAGELISTARHNGLFLMEAMWARFLPHMVRVRELISAGVLGEIRTVVADHGQRFGFDAAHRLFAPVLGGGALLDLGIYPVSFASAVLGTPHRVTAVSDPASTGVDAQTSILLQYPGGAHAVVTTTLEAQGSNRASIIGTEARIEIEAIWYTPTSFSLVLPGAGVPQRFESPRIGHGLRFEAAEVARCLQEGLTESPIMPLDETLSIMTTMDEVRAQIGLRYPSER